MSSQNKRPRQESNDGYETDTTLPDPPDTHSDTQDEYYNSLLQQINNLKTEVSRLTRNTRNTPSTPPTVKVNRSGKSLFYYKKVNDLYTKPGTKYTGDLYHFLPLTSDVNDDAVSLYDSNGNEMMKTELFGGKRRRTTHRKASKRGGNNKKSCKRTKKR